jgi:hypothetical protein
MKLDSEKLSGDVFENGEMIGTIRFDRVKE